jgi:hypothetical protein
MKWITAKFLWINVLCTSGWLYTAGIDYIVTISFAYILYCVCFNLHFGGFIMFCNVCVCVCVCVCGWVGGLVICTLTEVFRNLTEVYLTLPEGFPCFFLSYKANAKVKLAKTGHGPHCSTLVVICVVRLLFVSFYLLFVCKCVLPPGDNPIAVNKYIISYSRCAVNKTYKTQPYTCTKLKIQTHKTHDYPEHMCSG